MGCIIYKLNKIFFIVTSFEENTYIWTKKKDTLSNINVKEVSTYRKGFFMRTNKKYTVEYKMQIVKEYLETDLGYRLLSQKHGINATQIKDWVKIYRAHGEEGLIKSKQGRYRNI